MRRFGLIGFPLKHSFSSQFFAQKFKKAGITDAIYQNFPLIELEDVLYMVKVYPKLVGLNVTIPYKNNIIPYLDDMSEAARSIDAVNCIKIDRNPLRMTGYNTDVDGFEQSIRPKMLSHHQRALILGSGGSSKAVKWVFEKMGIEYKIVSRTPVNDQLRYDQLDASVMNDYTVIVNTTPLGMYPHNHTFPLIPYDLLGNKHLLFDLVYNPEKTSFLKFGEAKGASVKNGLEMLYLQAEKSWEIWNR